MTGATEANAAATRLLAAVAAARPLVHHLTSAVVANDVANMTLALGALPVMAEAEAEVAEVSGAAQAVVLNLGMLSPAKFAAMCLAGRAAAARGVPVVLDPVGAGATRFRTESALRLLAALPVAVVRGNRGEVGALVGGGAMRGVEAVGAEEPRAVAIAAARRFGCVVAVSGAVDVVADTRRVFAIANGDPLMARITGTGCMASAAVGVALTTGGDIAERAALALALCGLAGERAAAGAAGPGTFRARFLDAVAALATEAIAGLRIAVETESSGRIEPRPDRAEEEA